MKIAGICGVWAGVTVVTVLLLAPADSSAKPKEEYSKLESELEEAQDAYLEARSAHQDKDAKGSRTLVDPRLAILKRMDALANKTAGQRDGGYINIQTFIWSWMLDLDLDHLYDRFARAAKHYPSDPFIGEPLEMVPAAHAVSATPAKWIEVLDRLAQQSKLDYTRLTALLVMGQIQMTASMATDAKASFGRVVKMAPKSDFAVAAEGFVYELEHLQPGMQAPQFTATTTDGTEVSLESLRGKAVLLNFWAAW